MFGRKFHCFLRTYIYVCVRNVGEFRAHAILSPRRVLIQSQAEGSETRSYSDVLLIFAMVNQSREFRTSEMLGRVLLRMVGVMCFPLPSYHQSDSSGPFDESDYVESKNKQKTQQKRINKVTRKKRLIAIVSEDFIPQTSAFTGFHYRYSRIPIFFFLRILTNRVQFSKHYSVDSWINKQKLLFRSVCTRQLCPAAGHATTISSCTF